MPYPATPERICAAIGGVLRDYRKDRGLTQHQVAERAGLSQNVVSDIETGKRGPAFVTFLRLAYGLDVGPAELLDAIEQRILPPRLNHRL
jgi:transcriptional regulator with XRE-family HTH domain